jgi:hypothetical protein
MKTFSAIFLSVAFAALLFIGIFGWLMNDAIDSRAKAISAATESQEIAVKKLAQGEKMFDELCTPCATSQVCVMILHFTLVANTQILFPGSMILYAIHKK